jgi:hypothetical protein
VAPAAPPRLLLLLLAACAAQRPPYASGYLGDYSKLEKSTRYEDAWEWRRPGADLRAYERVRVAPVLVHPIGGSPAHGMDTAALRRIAEDFRAQVAAAVEPRHTAVGGGARTLRVQVVVTDVTPAAPGRNGGLAIEAEVADALTGTRVAAVVGRIEWPYAADAPQLDPARLASAYANWASRIRNYCAIGSS